MILPLKVNYKQGDDSLCGPACIRTVLKYYGAEHTEQQIAALCNHTYALGTTDHDMQIAVNTLGYNVLIKEFCTLDDISYWLQKDIPLIVDWFYGDNMEDQLLSNGHSSIVMGLDEDYIYILNPLHEEMMKIKQEEFLRVWFDFRTPTIEDWNSMIIRQIFVIIPKYLVDNII